MPLNRHSSMWIFTVGLVLSLLGISEISPAQDARLAEARGEGRVVWYTGATLFTAERVAKLFEQAYSGVKVEVQRSGSERILQRLMQEAAAGINNADVFNSSDVGHYVLLRPSRNSGSDRT